jgi:hypothetical protein
MEGQRDGAEFNEATPIVAYGKPDADGIYHIFLSNPDGSNELRDFSARFEYPILELKSF